MKIFFYICAAIVLFLVVMLIIPYINGDAKYEEGVYVIESDFSSLFLTTGEADITFAPSDGGECRIEVYKSGIYGFSSEVKDGSLNIGFKKRPVWYAFINLGFKSPEIKIYLPSSVYDSLTVKADTGGVQIPESFAFATVDVDVSTGDVEYAARESASVKISASTGHITVSRANVSGDITLSVSTGGIEISETTSGGKVTAGASTGDVEITSLKAASLAITTSTGDVNITDTTVSGEITQIIDTGATVFDGVVCDKLTTDGSTGDIDLKGFRAEAALTVKRSTGDVTFTDSDAGEITVEVSTGDVTGNLLSPKIFITSTNTGKISVPESTEGGKCKITTSTGKIVITAP